MCPACVVFACDRCWARSAGACPGCGVVVAKAASGPATGPPADLGKRQRRTPRVPLALGATAVAALAVAVVVGSSFRPTGRVEGAVGTPVGLASQPLVPGEPEPLSFSPPQAGEIQSAMPTPVPDGAATAGSGDTTPDSNGPSPDSQTAGGPGATQSLRPDPRTPPPTSAPTAPPTPATAPPASTPSPSTGPNPTPSPVPTPGPTPTPTPTPTPAPTPTPTPVATCLVVPDLVGATVADARAAWTAAGFTGSFSPAFGLNTKVVQTQSQSSGSCMAAETTMVVTYS